MGKIATQQEVKNKTGSTYPADSKKCCTYVDAIANYKAQVKGSYKSNQLVQLADVSAPPYTVGIYCDTGGVVLANIIGLSDVSPRASVPTSASSPLEMNVISNVINVVFESTNNTLYNFTIYFKTGISGSFGHTQQYDSNNADMTIGLRQIQMQGYGNPCWCYAKFTWTVLCENTTLSSKTVTAHVGVKTSDASDYPYWNENSY